MTFILFNKMILLGLMICLVLGCATTKKSKSPAGETEAEVQAALEAVAGSISGKQLSKEELDALAKDLETNEEAKSAVDSITGAVSGETAVVHYCPVDGKRFSPRVKMCPDHQVPLKKLE